MGVPLPTYPYGKSLYKPYIVGIYRLQSPRIPREHNKYHGYTVRGTSNCPLKEHILPRRVPTFTRLFTAKKIGIGWECLQPTKMSRYFFESKENNSSQLLSSPQKHMGVSKNRGTPKSSIPIGFSLINHPFWGIPIFGNIRMQRQQKEKALLFCILGEIHLPLSLKKNQISFHYEKTALYYYSILVITGNFIIPKQYSTPKVGRYTPVM